MFCIMLSILAPKKSRVRFSNIMEIRQLPSSHALEAKLSRMSYPTMKDQESILKTVGKLTATQVAKISFFFCFVVGFLKKKKDLLLFCICMLCEWGEGLPQYACGAQRTT